MFLVASHFRRDKAGFTLLELMVVITLMGILSAMIIPEMRGTFEHALLRSSARQFASVIELASSRAITLNRMHRVRFDHATGHFRVERPGKTQDGDLRPIKDIPGGEGEIDTRIRVDIHKKGTEEPEENGGEPVSTSEELERNEREALEFYSDGTASAAEVRLHDRQGFSLVLRINPITSRVKISEAERE